MELESLSAAPHVPAASPFTRAGGGSCRRLVQPTPTPIPLQALNIPDVAGEKIMMS